MKGEHQIEYAVEKLSLLILRFSLLLLHTLLRCPDWGGWVVVVVMVKAGFKEVERTLGLHFGVRLMAGNRVSFQVVVERCFFLLRLK